jgi:hypothetical protein
VREDRVEGDRPGVEGLELTAEVAFHGLLRSGFVGKRGREVHSDCRAYVYTCTYGIAPIIYNGY